MVCQMVLSAIKTGKAVKHGEGGDVLNDAVMNGFTIKVMTGGETENTKCQIEGRPRKKA